MMSAVSEDRGRHAVLASKFAIRWLGIDQTRYPTRYFGLRRLFGEGL